VSPSALERYLDAAQKISRLAIGDTTLPVLVNIHPLDPEHPQDERWTICRSARAAGWR
jgi:hypothetical protein